MQCKSTKEQPNWSFLHQHLVPTHPPHPYPPPSPFLFFLMGEFPLHWSNNAHSQGHQVTNIIEFHIYMQKSKDLFWRDKINSNHTKVQILAASK